MKISYGKEHLELALPVHTKQLNLQEPSTKISPDLFSRRLDQFLQKKVLDLSNPVLVVADKTRLCGYPEYLPLLIELLEEHGMDSTNLRIMIAYGTHPRQSDEECLQAYGEAYNIYCFVHHNCQEKSQFTELGHTSRGTPIRLRRDLTEASAIITMGPVCHHYFAGYGGGRKLIFPGCGEKEAIYANHGLYLDRQNGTMATGCQPGRLEDNPLAQDLFEIEEKMVADLAIHGILDSHGRLCDLLLGQGRQTFLQACHQHGKNCEVSSPLFATVIASCGGYPKDINFIQSHKAVHNAAMFVEDGGLLLIYCECRDEIGSKTFLPWFELDSFEDAFDTLSTSYEGNGGTALATMAKLQRIRIGLISSLDEQTCRLIGIESWSHAQVMTHCGGVTERESICYIPNASLLVKGGSR